MIEVSTLDYLRDEIEQLIEEGFEELKIKDIIVSKNLLEEKQIIITFAKE